VEQPFGGPPLPDSVNFVLARCTRFSGDADSERELVGALRGLEPGEHVAIRALGLSEGDGRTVKLYDVRSEVERDR
jgi:hypothetical protein